MREWLGRNGQLHILSQDLNNMLVELFNHKLQYKKLTVEMVNHLNPICKNCYLFIYLFHANVLFLHPKKRQKTRSFLTFSRSIGMEQCCKLTKILQEVPKIFFKAFGTSFLP